MNFDGFTLYPIERFSSLCEQDDPTNLPTGVLPLARNIEFRLTRARTRSGIQKQYGFTLPDAAPVTGLVNAKFATSPADIQVPLCFSALGNLYIESPAGSGKVQQVGKASVAANAYGMGGFGQGAYGISSQGLPVSASMQSAAAFQRAFLAFTDLVNAMSAPAVYDLKTGHLDPLSMLPVGQPWQANTVYIPGQVVTPATPVGGNGHSYIALNYGESGALQPNFPVTEGGKILDGSVNWQENTPVMAQALPEPAIPTVNRAAGAGAFAAGRDVYILVTLVNQQGETDGQTALAFKFVNTQNNDRLVVSAPTLANWVAALPVQYVPTGYNVYEADVATGGGAPAIGAYKKVNGGPVALNANANVDNTGAGAAPGVANSALVVPVGNICAGLRYMVVLFVNRNGYVSGMTQASVVSYTSPTNGFQLYVPHIPTGPLNTAARICAFTPAGQLNQLAGVGISNAGPYFWISPNFPNGIFDLSTIGAGVTIGDVENGISMTSTLINDNVTTSATFNFTDDYLKSTENDISAFFRKIQVPNCSDIYYSKTLRRMFYKIDALPSGWYVSLQDDPESVYGDTGIVQAAENTSERGVTVREYQGVVYLLKERSGHVLNADATNPTDWKAVQQWGGESNASGPCGPRAVDVCTSFMCYVHRSGVYIFEGGLPYLISKELPITWSRVNWAAKQTIWVMIDDDTREIRIGIPYDQSTLPNLVLKCSYEEVPAPPAQPRFLAPIHFSPYVGKEIATGACYKWSIDDIPANVCIRAERALPVPVNGWPQNFDLAMAQSQILYGSSNPDGVVSAVTPGSLDDNGAGIDSQLETACPVIMNGDGKVVKSLMGPNRLGGVQMNVDGFGQGSVYVLGLRAKDPKQGGPPLQGKAKATKGAEIKLKKPWIAGVPYSCGGSMTNERMRVRITNDCRPGCGFDVKYIGIFAQPITTARPR